MDKRPAEVARQGMDIEQLVTWALREQGLGWSAASGQDNGWMVLGTRVDTSGYGAPPPSAALWTDDDAMLVRQAIDALPAEIGALVLLNGRTGMRPDWCEEGEGQWVQERDGRGRPLWDWADQVNRTGEKRARMVFEGTRAELVRFHRAEYTAWREGLVALVAPLNKVMASHEAIGPFVSARPWDEVRPAILHAVAS
ncbi:hypothetical protein LJR016_004304 [Devosia sp. LjRoot16]|uniref:hypothetical protein n=1 Tax=Devosia sp. LjRoot16 TaxID=3342271 RepID=UPI003ECC418B